MRFKATQSNLMIQIEHEEVAEFLRKAIAYLVPRFTKGVYVLAEPAELASAIPVGARVVLSGQEPSNFLSSFRIILRPGEAVVVSSTEHRLTRDQWREVAEHVGA